MTATPGGADERTRPEILVMRSVAVLAILVHHLWEPWLPGGLAALDVFFVISGYLVTGILFDARVRDGRVALPAFLARRARRILPSAVTVLLACLVGMFAFVPITDWGRVAGELAASAVFLENWALIAAGQAYAAPDAATAVQHYWTLGVEAQFYLVWAVMLMLLLGRGAGTGRRRPATVGIAVVLVASLAVSIAWCAVAPASGYLSTATRMWELAAGALLAAVFRRIPTFRVALPLSIAGWLAIAVSFVVIDPSVPWPSWRALLPVGGAVLVIAAGVPLQARRWRRWTDNALTRNLAESSYAIYLWHWPLLVFTEQAIGHAPSTPQKAGIAVASLALGWITTKWVERPLRFGWLRQTRPLATLTIALLAIALVAVPPLAVRTVMQRTTELYTAIAVAPTAGVCVGAEARAPGAQCTDGPYPGLSPDPLGEWEQVSVLHGMGCATDNVSPDIQSCRFGNPQGSVRVALVGDSHAMKLWPALKVIADDQGWDLVTYLKAQCEFTAPAPADASNGCGQWRESVTERLRADGPWDLVVTTGASHATAGADAPDQFRSRWQPVIDAGAALVVVRDDPYLKADVHACVVAHLHDTSACDVPRADALHPDSMTDTARTMTGASVVDLTDLFCSPTTCFAVVGGVITHRDGDHITDAFSRSYAPYLAAQLAVLEPALFGSG
jgi:peptidoglycan/LPS O-acetylase OafA/YrhL